MVLPVVHRNDCGASEGTPEQGGASRRLERTDQGAAAEAYDVGGVSSFVDGERPVFQAASGLFFSTAVPVSDSEALDVDTVDAARLPLLGRPRPGQRGRRPGRP